MARIYSKVSMEMWGDKKFTALSAMKPSGQSLWVYLLTGRFRTSIPGLSLNVGIGALSDRLGWPTGTVERHWQEIADLGMAKADWRHGVIWMPKGIEHNEPESPNVIKGWGRQVLPECPLVTEALGDLEAYLSAHLSIAYAKAFRDTFRETWRQGSPNQEQEQYNVPTLTRPLGGNPIALSDATREAMARIVSELPAEARLTARQFHDALATAFKCFGLVEREARVPDRGDGRAGYVDLLVRGPESFAVELDRVSPRVKSVEKLHALHAQGVAGVVICRDAPSGGWWQQGRVWVWGRPASTVTPTALPPDYDDPSAKDLQALREDAQRRREALN